MSPTSSNSGQYETLFEQMLTIRLVEEKVAVIYHTDAVKSPVHLSIGQEAPSVAVCAALEKNDMVIGTYRGHALYLAREGDLDAMVAELYGKSEGCGRGKAGSMHLGDKSIGMPHTSAIVATGMPNAIGVAFAQKFKKENAITACFIGDGAVDEGAVSESMNFAGLKKLPLLIIVENNQFAIHSPISTRMPRPNFVERAAAFNVAGASVMDNDLDSMLSTSQAAIDHVRSGQGPFLLEIATYRWKEHVGPGDDWALGYRTKEDASPWFENDPLKLCGERIAADRRLALESKVKEQITRAFDRAEKGTFPDPAEMWDNVYA
ncbi:MAG: thiamine pyrophosphate-dependent dehydrogenase E1 component subunit alpha [Rhodospirillales bacterium]|nr:thiamine pyrophosphate-dependent dehydrogenase E1 component subunit alpha [Rhodospirillales bacterium]